MSESAIVACASSPIAAVAATAVSEKKVAAKKPASRKSKKKSKAAAHPHTQQMVDASIKNLKERGGSSLFAIKKYISATYKCDAQKSAKFINKYLRSAVASGKLIQTKGKGASGSFKLAAAAAKSKKGSNSSGKPESLSSVTSGANSAAKKAAVATKKIVKNSEKIRYILQYHYDKGRSVTQATQKVNAVYGPDTVPERTAQFWFRRFRFGNFDVKDEPRDGGSKSFTHEENLLI